MGYGRKDIPILRIIYADVQCRQGMFREQEELDV